MSSSDGIVSPKGSDSSSSSGKLVLKIPPGPVHFPAPFWEEKMARSYNIIKLLENNLDLRHALHRSPTLAGQFMKHPDVGREVARDKKLATEIIRRPHLLKELANFHHYAHLAKRREKVKSFVKQLEKDFIRDHFNETHRVVIPHPHRAVGRSASESEMSVAIGRATLPNIRAKEGDLPSIKYLTTASRLFLRHDMTLQDGCLCFCDKKTSYYNILNSHGRLMYRIFVRHKQVRRHFCRPLELVVKDPDGHTLFLFTQIRDYKFRSKLMVQYPRNRIVGYVEQKWTLWPTFHIRNRENECTIKVECTKRPFLSRWRYEPEFAFELRAIGAHNVIGKISAEWIDTPVRGAFENERIYGCNFPRDLTNEVKVTVLAAWMLVYFQYYQRKLHIFKHHNLSTQQMALVRLAEDTEDEKMGSSEPSSDSDKSKDLKMIEKCRKTFEAAAAKTEENEMEDFQGNYTKN